MTEPTCTEKERQRAIRAIQKKREYMLRYVQERKVEKAEYDRQRYPERREEIVEYGRQYYREHREERAGYMRQYLQENREKRAKYHSQHFQENKEEILEQQRQYYQEHPEVPAAARQRRRALLATSNGNFTAEEFRLLCETYGNRCAYCKQELPLGPDHKVPLSRDGSNSIENIVPSCRSCNLKKAAKTYDEYMEVISR